VVAGLELPDTWDDFSQHGYKCRPLSNAHVSGRDILEFRDKAFMTYFTHQPYLEMVRRKFGQAEADHIAQVISVPLHRQLLEPAVTE
jgi:anaerobic magnesium-protoporphyrin IX monomethyl ester cyclase